jgi:predicted lipid-binding transport protein (Tim44 family)
MNQAFDPINLIILAAAVVVFLRLRAVLGRRTGNERPSRWQVPQRTATEAREGAEDTGNVVTLPLPGTKPETPPEPAAAPVWTGYAESGSALARGLEKIAETDRQFLPSSFLEGAKIAYEMIVGAFASGDKSSLKNLLSRDVYDSFASAIDQREKAGETIEQKFVGIDKAEISAADLQNKRATVTVKFVSEMISATLDKHGEIIEGDPKQIREITDTWTFERDVTSRDPNWKLATTEAAA